MFYVGSADFWARTLGARRRLSDLRFVALKIDIVIIMVVTHSLDPRLFRGMLSFRS
jgi:hypothetical protein